MECTTKKWQKLNTEEEGIFRTGRCPDCKAAMIDGPSGGLSINYSCLDEECGSQYNDAAMFVERISDSQPRKSSSSRPYR